MIGLINLAMTIAFLVWIVCYIGTVVKFLAEGDQAVALISALGFFVCGIGTVVALAWGWYKAQKYRTLPWMIVWSAAWSVLIVGAIAKAILEP